MSIDDLLNVATQGGLLLIALLTLMDFLRQRDRQRLDIALMFGALASIILIQGIAQLAGQTLPWLSKLGAVLIFAQPYLLLRLVQYFRAVPPLIERAALAGMLISWVVLVFVPSPVPAAFSLTIVVYFASVEAYAALAFVRGALTTGGVTRNRLLLAASGSGMLALIILLAGINIVVPSGIGLSGVLAKLLAPLAALSYYLGFVPPRWLRHTWQLPVLFSFLQEDSRPASAGPQTETLSRLCEAAKKSVGGIAAAALWAPGEDRLVIRAASAGLAPGLALPIEAGIIERAWRLHTAAVAGHAADFGPTLARLAETARAGSCLAVPIATRESAGGLVLIFHRRVPLFVRDDLAVLTLLTEQTAQALDHSELLNEQLRTVADLRSSAEKLEAANKDLEAFSYSVSHDLRAPLRSVIGFAVALSEDYGERFDADGRHMLDMVRKSAVEMGQLIDDLLTFSRLGRRQISRAAVNMDEQVRSIVAELGQASPGRTIAFSLGTLPVAYGDRALFRQVWLNLLTNAVKFSQRREHAQIEVGSTASGRETIYYVKDNGAGFDMAYGDKLFGVFQRLHSNQEFEGTGIGLSIVRRIISRHGGRTWAEGAVDQGATVYFSLPQGENGHDGAH